MKESWNAEAHPKLSVEAIVGPKRRTSCPACCDHRWRAADYDLGPLTTALGEAGFRVTLKRAARTRSPERGTMYA